MKLYDNISNFVDYNTVNDRNFQLIGTGWNIETFYFTFKSKTEQLPTFLERELFYESKYTKNKTFQITKKNIEGYTIFEIVFYD